MQAPQPEENRLQQYDRVRVIGQGLVGSLLAVELDSIGIPFLVQDEDLPGGATAVAPGIVNPLAGRKFSPPENLPELTTRMEAALTGLEAKLSQQIWQPCPILRMFNEPYQIDRFKRNLTDEEKAAYVEAEYPENTFSEINDVFGSFLTKGGGWANLPVLMRTVRDWLRKSGRLVEATWDPADTKGGDPSELLIFCEGWQVVNNPHWSFIPHNPAKGEMLIVRFEDPLPRNRIYSQSCWIQPIDDDLWRIGATYSWDDFGSSTSFEGAQALQERLHLLTSIPFHVEDQVAGVRPIVEDYKPVIGVHPDNPNWYIVNAMGSKGVLQAPTAIQLLLDHLTTGSPLPYSWNVARFEEREDGD